MLRPTCGSAVLPTRPKRSEYWGTLGRTRSSPRAPRAANVGSIGPRFGESLVVLRLASSHVGALAAGQQPLVCLLLDRLRSRYRACPSRCSTTTTSDLSARRVTRSRTSPTAASPVTPTASMASRLQLSANTRPGGGIHQPPSRRADPVAPIQRGAQSLLAPRSCAVSTGYPTRSCHPPHTAAREPENVRQVPG